MVTGLFISPSMLCTSTKHWLRVCPTAAMIMMTNIVIVYVIITGINVLDALDSTLTEEKRQIMPQSVYKLRINQEIANRYRNNGKILPSVLGNGFSTSAA